MQVKNGPRYFPCHCPRVSFFLLLHWQCCSKKITGSCYFPNHWPRGCFFFRLHWYWCHSCQVITSSCHFLCHCSRGSFFLLLHNSERGAASFFLNIETGAAILANHCILYLVQQINPTNLCSTWSNFKVIVTFFDWQDRTGYFDNWCIIPCRISISATTTSQMRSINA